MPDMPTVSAVLVCLNSEKEIDRCLDSVAWCDEIVVVDSFSSDGTLARARNHTAHVHQHAWEGYSRQLDWACRQASGDWVFIIDADEVCSPSLAARCRHAVDSPAEDGIAGYEVARHVHAYGRRIRHGGYSPEYVLRLVRRERLAFRHRQVHGAPTVDGPLARLEEWLDHHTWPDLFRHVQRINTYTSLEVANMLAEQPGARASWPRILFSPLGHFLRRFVRHSGWRDGWHGFALAWLDAVHTGLLYFKLWEVRQPREGEGPPVTHGALEDARRRY